jgi:nucleotide-binding universal stress UspA family protein
MPGQILVPLDGSALAEQALSCAVTLARGLRAELVLLRAVSAPSDARNYIGGTAMREADLLERLDAEAEEHLREVADRVRGAGLGVLPVVRQGPAAEVIVDCAEQMDVWGVIMATHGYSGIRRWTHGSVAERVLQAASVPVLMVRAQEQAEGDSQQLSLCRRILVPLDGSKMAEQVLSPVRSAAQAVDAEVFLFQTLIDQSAAVVASDWYFLPPPGQFEEEERQAQAYLERVADSLREEEVRVFTATQAGRPAESIIEYAEANGIDLIAMSTHGRTGLARWALGSVADRVLRACRVPILLVRAR